MATIIADLIKELEKKFAKLDNLNAPIDKGFLLQLNKIIGQLTDALVDKASRCILDSRSFAEISLDTRADIQKLVIVLPWLTGNIEQKTDFIDRRADAVTATRQFLEEVKRLAKK